MIWKKTPKPQYKMPFKKERKKERKVSSYWLYSGVRSTGGWATGWFQFLPLWVPSLVPSKVPWTFGIWQCLLWGFPGGSVVMNPPANVEDSGLIPGSGRPLEKEMATYSTILAWEIPWTEDWWAAVHGVTKESDTTQQLNNNDVFTSLFNSSWYVFWDFQILS